MRKNCIFLIGLILLMLLPVYVSAALLIADHTSSVEFDQIPDEWIATMKTDLHIAYDHTSHGSQLVSGMNALKVYSPFGSKYNWNNGGTGGALDFHDYFSSVSDLGYETAWAPATRTYLNANPDVNVIIWSWCNIAGHSIPDYITNMESLIADYGPGSGRANPVTFVYMTGHTNGGAEGGSADLQNTLIRQYCAGSSSCILFDFSDLENYDPDNNYFLNKAVDDALNYDPDAAPSYSRTENWATDYITRHPGSENALLTNLVTSCAHSPGDGETANAKLNCVLKGKALWWLLARIAGWDGSGGTPPTYDDCSDGTNHGACSANQPRYCDDGSLIDSCSTCGCSVAGEECQTDGTCAVPIPQNCNDGTLHNQCSATQPLFCNDGTLANDCNTCECADGFECQVSGVCTEIETPDPADLDGDGDVDIDDLILIAVDFGKTSGYTSGADTNGDNEIDIYDIVFIASQIQNNPGLISYWSFDGDVIDSANGLDGVNYGATFVPGYSGQALSFDGVDDYVEVAHDTSLDVSDELTVMAWVNIIDDNTHHPVVVKASSLDSGFYFLVSDPDRFYFRTVNGGAYSDIYTSFTNYFGDWHHLAAVFDGTNEILYIDGVEMKRETPAITSLGISNMVLRMGRSTAGYWGGDTRLNGLVDEVRIYGKALTSNEILDLM